MKSDAPYLKCVICEVHRPPSEVKSERGFLFTCVDRTWCRLALNHWDERQEAPVPAKLRAEAGP